MSQGHTTPLLYLSRLFSDRHISVTLITTPANYSAIKATLKTDSISVIDIPFPDNIAGVPPGVEITDNLPSMSSFVNFVQATQQLQPRFEQLVRSLPPVTCTISDGFLIWTQDSADKLGIPRLIFYGANIYSMTMCNIMAQFKPHAAVGLDDEPFAMVEKSTWIQWLDSKLVANKPVLYVSFGSQAEASTEQLREVAIGLEQSNVSFMWVVKSKQLRLIGEGFEERVKGRGKVVGEWVDQMEILKHEIV
ncbi:hypothetical protein L1987_48150 [Smallanthus sonchifolius]|uniref:Uncharacterized protein n=1 Tax=Smallanthus sonchifolius TaxID=185202 RepID=A0ACB9FS19_9ASTR|nr:hypothetical protein L1987_48150 [Smallanthus sonchifolius]